MDLYFVIPLVIIIFFLGILVGFCLQVFLIGARDFDGIMHVIRKKDKIVYSLELNENPELLESRNEIIFKVETSDENSIRE